MLEWLCIIFVGILGISPSSRIPLEMAKKVFCVEAFESFTWGRVGFESLIGSIKVVEYEGKQSYTLSGCVHALIIWIFEFVPGIGERYGFKREGCDNLVPILCCAGSRKRLDELKLIKEEVENHGKCVDEIPKKCKSNNNQEKDNINTKETTTTKEVPAKVEMPSSNELVILGLNATIKACMEKVNIVQRKHDALEKELPEKIQSLEEEVNELKGKKTSPKQEASVEDANATLNKDVEEDDCSNSNTVIV
ncbi:unnamed protein product [Cochlearia groenlandica]